MGDEAKPVQQRSEHALIVDRLVAEARASAAVGSPAAGADTPVQSGAGWRRALLELRADLSRELELEAATERDRLARQSDRQSAQLQQLRAELQDAQLREVELQAHDAELEELESRARGQADRSRTRVRMLRWEFLTARRDAAVLARRLAAAQQELADEHQRFGQELALERERLGQELAGERERFTREHDRLTAEREQLAVEREQLVRQRDQFARQRDELAGQRDLLVDLRHQMTGRHDELAQNHRALLDEREQLARQNHDAVEQRERLAGEHERLVTELERLTQRHEAAEAEQEQALEELRGQLDLVERRLALRATQLQAIRRSRSFRIALGTSNGLHTVLHPIRARQRRRARPPAGADPG